MGWGCKGSPTNPAPMEYSSVTPVPSSQPGTEVGSQRFVLLGGEEPQEGTGQPPPGYQGGPEGARKEDGSKRPLPRRHHTLPPSTPLPPHPQPHCLTPFLPLNPRLQAWDPHLSVCATPGFRPFLLLSRSTGPCPAALDQTAPCRVRKSAFSRQRLDSHAYPSAGALQPAWLMGTALWPQCLVRLTNVIGFLAPQAGGTETLWAEAGTGKYRGAVGRRPGRAGRRPQEPRQAEGRAEKEEAVFWEPPGNPCSCAQHHPLIMLTTNICLQLYSS